MMQEERGNFAGAAEGRAGRSPANQRGESRPEGIWTTLMASGEIITSTYFMCRLQELNSRKLDMELEICRQHILMIEILQRDVDDLKNRVKNDDRIGGSRQFVLEECARFERDLQQSGSTSLTKPQHSTETHKLKVPDPHGASAVTNRVQGVYPRPDQASSRMPVKSVESHEQVQTFYETSTAAQTVPTIHSQENIRPQANIYSQRAFSSSHDDALAYSQQSARSGLGASCSARYESATERADRPTRRLAIVAEAGATSAEDGGFQRHVTKKNLPTNADRSSIDLLLFGQCGNGKSATGNSILGKAAFPRTTSKVTSPSSSASSIKMESTNIAGKVINVIDGPSINGSEYFTQDIAGKIHQSLKLCNYAYTALLIVLKFGINFPKQEIEALQVIKTVLGKDVIREYGVCVITCGDIFDQVVKEARQRDEDMTFDSWLHNQTGEVRKLFEECSFRCVLFDNWTNDNHKRQAQLHKLMEILPKGMRYSEDALLPASPGTYEFDMEGSLPTFLTDALAEAVKIQELIDQHEEIRMDDPEATQKLESNIKLKLRQLKEKANKMRASSVELENLKMILRLLESNLQAQLNKWQLERGIRMNLGAQSTTSDRSSTPSLADQRTMGIRNATYGSFGTDFNSGMSAPSDFNRGMPASSGLNGGMYAPTDFNSGMSASSDFNRGISAPSDVNRGMSAPSDVNRGVSAPSDVNRGVSAPSDFNRGTSAPSYFNRDMSASSDFNRGMSLGFATSENKTSSTVDNGSHACSNTGSMQPLPINNNPTIATGDMEETGIPGQHSDPPVNIKSFLTVSREMISIVKSIFK